MPGADIYLLLDGVLSVAVDGTQIGERGPGTVVGERSLLEDGRRTATLRAVTGCVISTASRDLTDRDSLASLAGRHHQEGPDSQAPRQQRQASLGNLSRSSASASCAGNSPSDGYPVGPLVDSA